MVHPFAAGTCGLQKEKLRAAQAGRMLCARSKRVRRRTGCVKSGLLGCCSMSFADVSGTCALGWE